MKEGACFSAWISEASHHSCAAAELSATWAELPAEQLPTWHHPTKGIESTKQPTVRISLS